MGKSDGVAQPSRSVFTCQNLLGTWIASAQLAAKTAELPQISQRPSRPQSPPSPLHVTRNHHEGFLSAPSHGAFRCVGSLRRSNTQRLSRPSGRCSSRPPIVCVARAPKRASAPRTCRSSRSHACTRQLPRTSFRLIPLSSRLLPLPAGTSPVLEPLQLLPFAAMARQSGAVANLRLAKP